MINRTIGRAPLPEQREPMNFGRRLQGARDAPSIALLPILVFDLIVSDALRVQAWRTRGAIHVNART